MSTKIKNRETKYKLVCHKLLVLFAFLFIVHTVSAVTKTWNASSGNWNTSGNWSPSGVPLAGDDVILPSDREITVNVAAVCNSFTFGNNSNKANKITISGTNSLTVTGAITFVNPFGDKNDQTLAVNAGTLTCGSIIFANTSSGKEDNIFTVSTGIVNVGNIVFGGASNENSFVISGAGTLNITGAGVTGATTGTFTVDNTGTTVNYSGVSAQTIRPGSYYNLNISGTKTANSITIGSTNVFNTFTNTATFTSGAYIVTGTFNYNGTGAQTIAPFNYADLTISRSRNNNNITFSNTGIIGISGAFTPSASFNNGTFITTGSTINFNGDAQNIGAFTFNNLTCSGTGTKTVTAAINVNGTLNIGNGVILNMATFVLGGTLGTIAGTGSLTTQAVSTSPIPSGKTWTGSVDFGGTGAQTVVAGTFGNLTISGARAGSNNVTLINGGTINVVGTFSYTATFSSGALVTTNNTVNLSGGDQNIGGTSAVTLNNLTCSGSNTKTAVGILNINGILTVNNGVNVDMGTNTLGGTIASTSGTGTLLTKGAIPAGETWSFTINYNGTGTQTAVAGTYSNLTCSGSGTKAVASAISINGTLTINSGITLNMSTFLLSGTLNTIAGTGSLVTQAVSTTPIPSGKTWTCSVEFGGTGAQTIVDGTYTNLTVSGARGANSITLINGGTINVSGTFAYTAAFTSGSLSLTGNTINFNGAAQNIPTFTFNNLTCSGSGSKTLTGTVTVSGTLTISANTLLLNNNQLNINGTLAGTPVFVGSLNATLTFGGTGALGANINFSQTSATTRTLKDLVVNRTTSTIALANPLEIIGTVTLNNGTLASSGNLKLLSSLNSTARIAQVQGTGAITGNVIVQRFINASARRFRFMSSPISNGTLEDWRGEMFITGNNAPTAHQSTTVGGALNWGFDATIGNQATVFTYNETVLGNLNLGYTEVKNSTNTLTNVPLTIGRGYRVFVRGDRSSLGFLNGTNNTQNAVTTDLVGTPNVGNIAMPVTFTSSGTAANDGWCLLGNPYACEYDWNAHWDAGNSGGNSGTFYTNIDPTVYVFDPNSNSFKSYSASANSGTISNGIIPSGQAFFVKATASSPSLTFKEQFKVAGSPSFMFKANSADKDEFRLRLKFDSINFDDYILKFIPSATNKNDNFDIVKLRNSNFNISSYASDSVYHALDARPEVKQNDTLFLNVTGVNGVHRIIVQNIPPNKYFYLVDNMLNLMIPLSNDLEYPFQIQTSNTKSFGNSRFYIVVSNNATLPVKLNAFAVNLLNRNAAQLNWVTSLEINNSYFEIERSLDGENFEVVGRVKGNGSTSKTINYSYTDNLTEIKANVIYYRLNQYDFDGSNELSPVRSVNLHNVEEDNSAEKTVQLAPNPVVSKTRLTFNTKITAEVEVKIFSEMGLLVDVIQVNQLTNPSFELDLSALETGMYILEAIDKANHKFTAKFLKQ